MPSKKTKNKKAGKRRTGVKSASYKRPRSVRKKLVRSVGSQPALNLTEREQYKRRANDNSRKFLLRLKRRRNRGISKPKPSETAMYNEIRPLYEARREARREAEKRLAKSKAFLNKRSVRKPTELGELPDELLHEIYKHSRGGKKKKRSKRSKKSKKK